MVSLGPQLFVALQQPLGWKLEMPTVVRAAPVPVLVLLPVPVLAPVAACGGVRRRMVVILAWAHES